MGTSQDGLSGPSPEITEMESGKVGAGREGCFPSRKSYKWSGVSEQDRWEDVRCDRESAGESLCLRAISGQGDSKGGSRETAKGPAPENRAPRPPPCSGECGVPWPSTLAFQAHLTWKSVQFRSIAQSCPALCDPMDCSTPGLPVHHQLWNLLKLMSSR